jgi:hypothetical protein
MVTVFAMQPVSVGPTSTTTGVDHDGICAVDSANASWLNDPTINSMIGNPANPMHFFGATSRLTIAASGLIGSGVFATGQTPPGGWDMHADDDNWLYFAHGDSFRYSLIGALMDSEAQPGPDDWFFIGDGLTLTADPLPVIVDPMTAITSLDPGLPTTWKRLWLACNRPAFRGLDNGDGFWAVNLTLEHFTVADAPDCSHGRPAVETSACRDTRGRLASQRTAVLSRCSDANRLHTTIGDRAGVINGLLVAFGIDLAALGVIGTVAGTAPSGNAFHAAEHLAQGTIAAALTGAGVGGLVVGSLAAIGGEFDAAIVLLISAGFVALAIIGTGAAIAVSASFWLCLLVAVLVAIGLGLLAAITALGGEQIHDAHVFDQDLRDIQQAQDRWRNLLAAALTFCCPTGLDAPHEGDLPTC